MATTPAEYLIEVAAVTDRDRWLITQRRGEGDVMIETGDKIAAHLRVVSPVALLEEVSVWKT
jgi:hypothetical protein